TTAQSITEIQQVWLTLAVPRRRCAHRSSAAGRQTSLAEATGLLYPAAAAPRNPRGRPGLPARRCVQLCDLGRTERPVVEAHAVDGALERARPVGLRTDAEPQRVRPDAGRPCRRRLLHAVHVDAHARAVE